MTDWIKVKDRLPPVNKRLCVIRYANEIFTQPQSVMWRGVYGSDGSLLGEQLIGKFNINFTHYIVLPDNPLMFTKNENL